MNKNIEMNPMTKEIDNAASRLKVVRRLSDTKY